MNALALLKPLISQKPLLGRLNLQMAETPFKYFKLYCMFFNAVEWVDTKLYITLNLKCFGGNCHHFMLPCIPFCNGRVATKLYVLRFEEVENNFSALHQTLTVSKIRQL